MNKLPALPNIKKLHVHYHFLSDEVMKRIEALPIETDVSEQEKAERWKGELWLTAMLTE